jgi:hypothetical protein
MFLLNFGSYKKHVATSQRTAFFTDSPGHKNRLITPNTKQIILRRMASSGLLRRENLKSYTVYSSFLTYVM